MKKIRNYMVGLVVGFLSMNIALAMEEWHEEIFNLDDGDTMLVSIKKADIGSGAFIISCSTDSKEIYPSIAITKNGQLTNHPVLEVLDTHLNDIDSLTEPFINTNYRTGRGIQGLIYMTIEGSDDFPYTNKEYMESLDAVREFGHTFKTPFDVINVYFHSLEGVKETRAWEFCAER